MRTSKRIVALNLALLLMISPFFCLPAYSEDDDVLDGEAYPSQTRPEDRVTLPEESVTLPDGMAGDMEAASDAYRIYVGSTSFYSNVNASGTGWEYSASDNLLVLDGYSGSSIRTSGDLVIYSFGTVNVGGTSGTYGSNAMTVDGNLDVYIIDGTATMRGGTGSNGYGGDGIQAGELYVVGYADTAFNCIGGYGSTYGGYGIYADSIWLYPETATVTGGSGGYGDSSTYCGSGINFISYLRIGLCRMTVQGGGTTGYAISSRYGDDFYIFQHVALTYSNNHAYTFAPKLYELTLNGNGGTRSGSGYAHMFGYYPTYTDLSNYLFSRSGYSQVGWSTNSNLSPFIPLSERYLTTSDTTLFASWTDVDGGTVLFVGNGGTMGGAFFAKTGAGASVRVLDENDVSATDRNLIGWTDSLRLTSDENNMLCNSGSRWYLPGTTALISGETTLYAQWASNDGNIIYYDGNGGANLEDSTAAVQGILTSASSLSLYVQDDMGFEKHGYRFGGWRDAAGVDYPQGTEIPTPAEGLSVTKLFARWLKIFSYTASSSDGKDDVTCVLTPELGTVDVTLSVTSLTSSQADSVNVFYALYRDNRLIGLSSKTVTLLTSTTLDSATVEYQGSYTPDACKVFITTDNCAPACEPIICPFE